MVIWVLRTACTDLRISKDGDPHSPSVPFTALTQKKSSLFSLYLPSSEDSSKTTSLLRCLFQHLLAYVWSQAQSLCWLPLSLVLFSFVVSGSLQLDTAHQKWSHSKCQVEGNNLMCPFDTDEKLSL